MDNSGFVIFLVGQLADHQPGNQLICCRMVLQCLGCLVLCIFSTMPTHFHQNKNTYLFLAHPRRYMAEILPILRKTLSNQ